MISAALNGASRAFYALATLALLNSLVQGVVWLGLKIGGGIV